MERKWFSTGHYAGNKRGGKYLRSPDIAKQRLDTATSMEKD